MQYCTSLMKYILFFTKNNIELLELVLEIEPLPAMTPSTNLPWLI